ncbi:hypothetical protein KSP39_PZI006832 [Platanthera zijinensis]|uniref:Uncharacterized protein n=1 Tax=Platanthera zijinensis TaxID=2320716 RepID=A0AAP0G9I0_9ASPA
MNRRVKLCCSRLFCRDSFMTIMVSGPSHARISPPFPLTEYGKQAFSTPTIDPKLLRTSSPAARSSKATAESALSKKLTFTDAVKEFSFVKDRVEVMDHEKFIVKQAVIEGGLIGKRLKSYSYEMKFEVGSNGGTVGKNQAGVRHSG